MAAHDQVLSPAELPFGAKVRALFTKWDGTPHWQYDLLVLGADEYGVWVAGAPGGLIRRPGREIVADVHWVTLYPRDDMWVATFNDVGGHFSAQVYVDITTVPSWWHRPDGVLEVSAIDLDLDVIRRFDGDLLLDDEDEFDDHRIAMDYPEEIVAGAQAAAERVVRDVGAYAEPFDQIAAGWLAMCRRSFAATTSATSAATPPKQEAPTHEPRRAQTSTSAPPSADGKPQDTDWLATWEGLDQDGPVVVAHEEPRDRDAAAQDDGPARDEEGWEAGPGEPNSEVADAGDDRWDDDRVVDVEGWSMDGAQDIDTTPVDPSDVTGLFLTTAHDAPTPLWFDGESVTPDEVGIPAELADHLYDWLDLWRRDWDPVMGWQPRARIADYEALGIWLARRVKDAVGGVRVTVQLAHLGVSSLAEVPPALDREPLPVLLDPTTPAELPVQGDFVTLDGVVGCFTSEVNTRLSAWAADGGADEQEKARLVDLMTVELGPDYRVACA